MRMHVYANIHSQTAQVSSDDVLDIGREKAAKCGNAFRRSQLVGCENAQKTQRECQAKNKEKEKNFANLDFGKTKHKHTLNKMK